MIEIVKVYIAMVYDVLIKNIPQLCGDPDQLGKWAKLIQYPLLSWVFFVRLKYVTFQYFECAAKWLHYWQINFQGNVPGYCGNNRKY